VTLRRQLAAGATALLLLGCAAEETRQLADPDPAPISGGVIVDTTPTTSAVPGSPGETLAEMAAEMSRLSALVAEDGDAEGSLDRIVLLWANVEPEIDATRPGLVNGIATTVDLAETSVVRNRPADADKAFALLTDLVDSYTGDG
jgi:hypothetical protein